MASWTQEKRASEARSVVILALGSGQFIAAAMNGDKRTSIEGTNKIRPAKAAAPPIGALDHPSILKAIRCLGRVVQGKAASKCSGRVPYVVNIVRAPSWAGSLGLGSIRASLSSLLSSI